MPLLLWIGLGGLTLGGVGGYMVGGGVNSAATGIKYAALGVTAIVVAKQMGWLK